MMKEYEFERNGGSRIVNGKTEWPDYLCLTVDREGALELIETLARAIRHIQPNLIVTIPLLGELTEMEPD